MTFSLDDLEKFYLLGESWVVRTAVEIVLYNVIKVASLHTVSFAARRHDLYCCYKMY